MARWRHHTTIEGKKWKSQLYLADFCLPCTLFLIENGGIRASERRERACVMREAALHRLPHRDPRRIMEMRRRRRCEAERAAPSSLRYGCIQHSAPRKIHPEINSPQCPKRGNLSRRKMGRDCAIQHMRWVMPWFWVSHLTLWLILLSPI